MNMYLKINNISYEVKATSHWTSLGRKLQKSGHVILFILSVTLFDR